MTGSTIEVYSGFIYSDFKSDCVLSSKNFNLNSTTPTSVTLGSGSYTSNANNKLTLPTPNSVSTNNIFYMNMYDTNGSNYKDENADTIVLSFVPNFWQSTGSPGYKVNQDTLVTTNYDQFGFAEFKTNNISWNPFFFTLEYVTKPVKGAASAINPDPKFTAVSISDFLSDSNYGGHLVLTGGISSTVTGVGASDGNNYTMTLSITLNSENENPFFNGNLLNTSQGVDSESVFINSSICCALVTVTALKE